MRGFEGGAQGMAVGASCYAGAHSPKRSAAKYAPMTFPALPTAGLKSAQVHATPPQVAKRAGMYYRPPRRSKLLQHCKSATECSFKSLGVRESSTPPHPMCYKFK